MTIHDIGPDFVKIAYSANGHNHTLQLSLNLAGTTGTDGYPQVLVKSGQSEDLTDAIDGLIAYLVDFYNTSDSFSTWTLYHKDNPLAQPSFVATDAITGGAGTALTADVNCGMLTMSFRTMQGNRFRFVLMESVEPVNEVYDLNSIPNPSTVRDLMTFLTSNNSPVATRDGHYPASLVRMTTKTSDALRKQYILS